MVSKLSNSLHGSAILSALNILDEASLPALAARLVADGLESPALIELAGIPTGNESDIRRLFAGALVELGISIPDSHEALHGYAHDQSCSLLAGEISPYECAKAIWHACLASGVVCHDLDPFIYAASEFEDRSADRDFFSCAILEEARRWAKDGKPSHVTPER